MSSNLSESRAPALHHYVHGPLVLLSGTDLACGMTQGQVLAFFFTYLCVLESASHQCVQGVHAETMLTWLSWSRLSF